MRPRGGSGWTRSCRGEGERDGEQRSVIPEREITVFLLSVEEALDLAASGEVLSGYRCLLGMLERAEEARDLDEPWGPELVTRCRIALRNYGEQHGLRVE